MTLLGSKRARTTAYHPQSNGMVERFHRQLKAALKAQHNSSWMDTLPLVLLGIRTALKEDISSTAAEMVYGTTLRLPGEFFTVPTTLSPADSQDYVSQLKAHMRLVRPSPPRFTQRNTRVSKILSTATHVFIRHDAVRKPLQPPYDGPYPVVKRTNKYFVVNINGRNNTVSVDRLKPAHLDIVELPRITAQTEPEITPAPSDAAPAPPEVSTTPKEIPCRTTRSGRQVHWPKHLSSYVS